MAETCGVLKVLNNKERAVFPNVSFVLFKYCSKETVIIFAFIEKAAAVLLWADSSKALLSQIMVSDRYLWKTLTLIIADKYCHLQGRDKLIKWVFTDGHYSQLCAVVYPPQCTVLFFFICLPLQDRDEAFNSCLQKVKITQGCLKRYIALCKIQRNP